MTETAMDTNLPTTPLAALLNSAAAQGDNSALGVYRGVLTPRKLDAPERERLALLSTAAVHDLGWLKRVQVRGEDRFRWLSGMVTNMVNELAEDSGAWNLVLNAQGRILGDLEVWREGDKLELEIATDQQEKLMEHLDRFIIMDDVELTPLTEATALGLSGPLAGEILERLGLPALKDAMSCSPAQWKGLDLHIVRGYGALVPHYELWVPAEQVNALWKALTEAGAQPVGTESLEALRIVEGIPAYGVEMVERDLPQETSQMRALHFNKGCYQGQEIVERIRARGSVHRHLRQLELDGPLPEAGTELSFQSAAGATAAAGEIRSVAEIGLASGKRIFALGMIRGEAEAATQLRNQPLDYTAGEVAGKAKVLHAPPELTVKFS